MTDNVEKKRIDTIDILRALGILIMVAGHVPGIGGKFDRYIHSFHMPLFFLISGYLYRAKSEISITKQIILKAKRIMIPYLFYALINYLFWLFLEGDTVWYKPLINLVTYNTHDLPICGALWFLTALFWAEVVYLILDTLLQKRLLRCVVVYLCSLIMALVQNHTDYRMVLTIDTALVCLAFLETGRLIRDTKDSWFQKVQNFNTGTYILSAALFLGCNLVIAFINPYVNLKSGWYGIVPVFFVNACVGTTGYFLISVILHRVLAPKSALRQWMVMIGRLSLIYMGLNQLFIKLVGLVLKNSGAKVPNVIGVGIVYLLTILLLSIISILADRIKSKKIRTLLGV